jgi:hypothetical protein
MNVFETVREGFNVYLKGMLGPPDPEEKLAKEKEKKKQAKKALSAANPKKEGKFDEFGRETKQRKGANLKDLALGNEAGEGGGGGGGSDIEQQRGEEERSSMSKGSSSSDLVSLSSEDSDVAVLNAPVLSEVTPYFDRWYSRYVQPTREYLDSSGITATSTAAANVVLENGRVLLYNVATTTYSLATNLFSISGQILRNGLVATGNQLYPHFVDFMGNVIDGERRHITNQPTINPTTPLATNPPTELSVDEIESSIPKDQPVEQERITRDIHYTLSTQQPEENVHANSIVVIKEDKSDNSSELKLPNIVDEV